MDLITPGFGIIFWQTVTLLVVIFVLGKFAWKPILHLLSEREHHIAKSLQDAEEAKDMVARMKEEHKQMLDRIAEEEKTIVLEAINSKNAIIESAVKEAKQVSERMLKQAQELIAREKALAFDQLKQDVAHLSIQVAEKLLRQELSTQAGQEALVKKLVEETNCRC